MTKENYVENYNNKYNNFGLFFFVVHSLMCGTDKKDMYTFFSSATPQIMKFHEQET